MEPNIAANEIKRIFRDNLYKRSIESKKGALKFSSLYKHKVSKKVFEKPGATGGKKYNIEVLLDTSGSMSGQKYLGSAEVCHYLCDLLGPVSNFNLTLFNYVEETLPRREYSQMCADKGYNYIQDKYMEDTSFVTEIIGGVPHIVKANEYHESLHMFGVQKRESRNGYSYYDCNKYVRQDITTKRKGGGVYEESSFRMTSSSCAGNRDMCSIQNAAQRLRNLEGHKFIIVILDGRPSLDYHDEIIRQGGEFYVCGRNVSDRPSSNYKNDILKLINEGINVIGIGLGCNLNSQFPVSMDIRDPKKIYNIIVDYFKNFTHKNK